MENTVSSDLERVKDEILAAGNLPRHVAVIMDGNGRWAQKRGLPRIEGHRAGIKSVRDIVEATGELGVEMLTLYAFSTENWNRPRFEVSVLMKLLLQTINSEINELDEKNVKVTAIGRLHDLPDGTRKALVKAMDRTTENSGLILNLALSYSGRSEIIDAIKKLGQALQKGTFDIDAINEAQFQNFLYTTRFPDPDLLIRTSGELRLSNFMLWQMAYTEIWVTDVLWPDFRRQHLYQALKDYQARERRFGLVFSKDENDTIEQ
ncbi:MAG: isoprenyl transferase [Gemmatimonadota bacterium]|nr:MAG: isoprenyl transferase [Gemmatimonadota bacterium]